MRRTAALSLEMRSRSASFSSQIVGSGHERSFRCPRVPVQSRREARQPARRPLRRPDRGGAADA